MEKGKELVIASSGDNLLIDARLLHQQLQVTSRFNDWINNRITDFGFERDKDYFVYSNFSNQKFFSWGGNRRSVNYHLTMDMAKELAMVERSDVGRQVRRYFIAVEKEMREAHKTGRILPKGIRSSEINGRRLYPYLKLAGKLGYKSGGGLYSRRRNYPNHFVRLNKLWYCTEEMANLLAMHKSTVNHRETIRHMQPVLPLSFGSTPILM